jgi:hypothetical protein
MHEHAVCLTNYTAGALGSVGGGLDRQTEESLVTEYMLQWRLNVCRNLAMHFLA